MKILWAIDPFDEDVELWKKGAQVLREISEEVSVEVEPVYALAADGARHPEHPRGEAAKRLLGQTLNGLNVKTSAPQVAIARQSCVQAVLRRAQAAGSDLIVVGSHGRRGLKRAVLGSFSEELVLESPVPVMVIGPRCDLRSTHAAEILVPTDLSDAESAFFGEAFGIARATRSGVRLLHVIPRAGESLLRAGAQLFSGAALPEAVPLAGEHPRAVQGLRNVISRNGQGVTSELLVDDGARSVSESVVAHATEGRSRFIAIAAKSGPITSALIGSITREVIRSAPCPVIVGPLAHQKRGVTLV